MGLPDSNSSITGTVLVDQNGGLMSVTLPTGLSKGALMAAISTLTTAGVLSGPPNSGQNPSYGLGIAAYPFAVSVDPTNQEPYGSREGCR